MKKFLFTLLFCCAFIGFSQETILLKGQLVFSSMNTSAINIVNTATHFGTINNANGEFEIEVGLGDVLLFSSVQYEPYHLTITREIINKRWVQIELVPGVNELKPVTISSNSLTGNLKTDLNTVEVGKYYNNASFGIAMPAPKLTVEERRLYTAMTSAGGIPLDPVLNAISGRLKKLQKLLEYAELDQLIEKARNSMETDFFVSQCGIPEKYITLFLYVCALDEDFDEKIRLDDKFDLVKYFKGEAKYFKENYLNQRLLKNP